LKIKKVEDKPWFEEIRGKGKFMLFAFIGLIIGPIALFPNSFFITIFLAMGIFSILYAIFTFRVQKKYSDQIADPKEIRQFKLVTIFMGFIGFSTILFIFYSILFEETLEGGFSSDVIVNNIFPYLAVISGNVILYALIQSLTKKCEFSLLQA